MSTNAETCPHCGETDFFEEGAPSKEKARCEKCGGTGSVTYSPSVTGPGGDSWRPLETETCLKCHGYGYYYRVTFFTVDVRTGKRGRTGFGDRAPDEI